MAPTMADDRMYRVAAAVESAVGVLTPPELKDSHS
jgi:aspartyl-tRNA(Asn)/glutamyl-tRNA(Gln) amidotransferase subunit A